MGIKELHTGRLRQLDPGNSQDLVQELKHFILVGSRNQLFSHGGGSGEILNVPAKMFSHQIGPGALPVPFKH